MKIIRGLQQQITHREGCVATIGNFDGVHLGHQQVLTQLKAQSEALNLPAVVISFNPLPHEFFPGDTPTRIYPQRDKMRLLSGFGIDEFVCLTFNNAFSQIEAEDFIQDILLDKLRVKSLIVGDDFRFGKMRKGDFAMLQQIGSPAGMAVQDTKTYLDGKERVSSTWIRNALQEGHLDTAKILLGRSYMLSGRIRHGDKLGRAIGYPTINLKLPEIIALRSGIYAVKIHGLDKTYYGAASVGKRPTVNGEDMRLETYVFDFNADVYGQYICIEPIKFMRTEEKFESVEIMTKQINQDCQDIRNFFEI